MGQRNLIQIEDALGQSPPVKPLLVPFVDQALHVLQAQSDRFAIVGLHDRHIDQNVGVEEGLGHPDPPKDLSIGNEGHLIRILLEVPDLGSHLFAGLSHPGSGQSDFRIEADPASVSHDHFLCRRLSRHANEGSDDVGVRCRSGLVIVVIDEIGLDEDGITGHDEGIQAAQEINGRLDRFFYRRLIIGIGTSLNGDNRVD